MRGDRGRNTDLLLHDQDEVMAGLKGSVQLDEVGVVQLVHHLDLVPDNLLSNRNTRSNQITAEVYFRKGGWDEPNISGQFR